MEKKNKNQGGSNGVLLLTEAPLGTPLIIKGIDSGRQAKSRLASIGIIPGEELRVIRRDNGGPLLLDIKGSRIALGQGISSKVRVERYEGSLN